MGMETPCLGAHSGSLKKSLVAWTHNLGAPGTRAPVRQQPWVMMGWGSDFLCLTRLLYNFNTTTLGGNNY